MALINVQGSVEYSVGCPVCTIMVQTSDPIATIMSTGYLNGSDTTFEMVYTNTQMAIVSSSDTTPVWLAVQIDGESNINLVAPTTI